MTGAGLEKLLWISAFSVQSESVGLICHEGISVRVSTKILVKNASQVARESQSSCNLGLSRYWEVCLELSFTQFVSEQMSG